MNPSEFKKALEFDQNDPFAMRLFTFFESRKHSDFLTMDDFIVGLAKVAPGIERKRISWEKKKYLSTIYI